MRGIILSGGHGTRLHPITKAISKQLIPIYDKPMIYYPLSVLMLAGIREILVITNREFVEIYRNLLGDGKELGLQISYRIQEEPRGLADALIISEDFTKNEPVCLILGDNVFYGTDFSPFLESASALKEGAIIFGYYVKNPEEFGVVEFSKDNEVISLEEKPKKPKSRYAIPGLYFYDGNAAKYAKTLKPSARGELEITDLNRVYLEKRKLRVKLLGRGFAWLDTGTYDGLANASDLVRTVQKRTGLYIGCIEEIAYNKGFINKEQLIRIGKSMEKTEYGEYILGIARD